ncbi:hypothetical protein [Weissella viridescens]|uniref:hypothetical protein n=1 Tax=Weissella viridescens TaxID=1629 RepID=UPI00405727FF
MNLPAGAFYIEPTPLSGWLWLGIWIGAIILILTFMFIGGSLLNKGKSSGWAFVLMALFTLLGAGYMGGSSYYYNYTHSSTYVQKKKEYKLEYDNNQQRRIEVKEYQGKTIYEYTGTFSFKRDGHGLNLTDNKNGKKISIYIGDNDTLIVTDI